MPCSPLLHLCGVADVLLTGGGHVYYQVRLTPEGEFRADQARPGVSMLSVADVWQAD
ncbi:MAG: hypothetical protein M3P14_02745 [Chloroflexota bacterium]|nr:hypothetical protein [Chloroflexota bacterium]